jgi:hypothetical protein
MPKQENRSAAERSLAARVGAFTLHSKYDSRDLTAHARAAAEKRFEDQVDPERKLPDAERQRRVEHARKAYFARLALASAKARRAKKSSSA